MEQKTEGRKKGDQDTCVYIYILWCLMVFPFFPFVFLASFQFQYIYLELTQHFFIKRSSYKFTQQWYDADFDELFSKIDTFCCNVTDQPG